MLQQGDIIAIDNDLYLVISHSCDIAADEDKEPNIDVIQCREFSGNIGNYANGRNCRKYVFSFSSDRERIVSVDASEKKSIAKHSILDADSVSKHPDLFNLQTWLSCRYKRHAFPNVLNHFLMELLNLKKTASNYNDEFIGFWIYYESNPEESACISDYEVKIFAVFDSEKENSESSILRMKTNIVAWEKKAEKLGVIFSAYAELDIDVSYYDLKHYHRLFFDYLSPEENEVI